MAVLAMVLPLLTAAFQSPVQAEEAALSRDLTLSICQTGEGQKQLPDQHDHMQCCILCQAGTVAAVTPVAESIVFPARQPTVLVLAGVQGHGLVRPETLPMAPRGPPAA